MTAMLLKSHNNNNGPNGHLFYVGDDLKMRRGMLPIIMLPNGDLRIVLHLVPFWFFIYLFIYLFIFLGGGGWGGGTLRKPW